jgi:anti-anti-sigma regulatory factor
MLSVVVHDFGELAIVRCAGRLVHGQETAALGDAVAGLSGKRVIVLDLAESAAIDAGGVGLLVSLHEWARGCGIGLKLMSVPERVREVLELAKVESEFEICTGREIAAFLGFGDATGPRNPWEERAAS